MAQEPVLLVLGAGNKMPTFIKRRINALDRKGVHVVVPARGKIRIELNRATIVKLRQVSWERFIASVFASIRFLLYFPHNIRIWRFLSDVDLITRFRTAIESVDLVALKKVDVIHFQWLTPDRTYSWLRRAFPDAIFVVSVRGSQVTVNSRVKPESSDFILRNFELADKIHCVSHDLAFRCKLLGAPEKKIFVNYNGINVDRFKPLESLHIGDNLRLVSVGALIWRKGYLFQLQMLRELVNRRVEASLTIVGAGPDAIGLEYCAYRMGLADKVTFLGQKPEEEVARLLPTMDVYLSSSAAEGLANSLVEAAACGLPIVAFECEGAKEIIEDGVTGYVVAFGDVAKAADCIENLVDPNLRRQMGKNARLRVTSLFEEDSCTNKMVEFYRNALQEKAKQ